MEKINPSVKFFINLAKTQTILSQRFDKGLGGLGFNEFLIIFHLSLAEGEKMRRIDLAEKIGLTASGITRLLLPMEKIGLVKSGPAENDARARYVMPSASGKQKMSEALERMEIIAEEVIPAGRKKEIAYFSELLKEIGGRTLMS